MYAHLALAEEREVRAQFGEEYIRYSENTPRFLPRIGSAERTPAGSGGKT
jgi:protein-S-isoprenylcysteine O-methyltransferase Ste14